MHTVCQRFDIGEVHLLGDFVDLYQLSSHYRDPAWKGKLWPAVKLARKYLTELVEVDGYKVHYHEGNHEERAWKYLGRHAEELSEVPNLTVPGLLGLDDLGIPYHRIWEPVRCGPIVLTHGTKCRPHSGYSAKAALDEFGQSVIVGHTHRIGAIARRYPPNRTLRAYENGCLCKLTPSPFNQYTKGKADWQQGFTILEVGSRSFKAHQFLIENGVAREF